MEGNEEGRKGKGERARKGGRVRKGKGERIMKGGRVKEREGRKSEETEVGGEGTEKARKGGKRENREER